MHVAANIMPLWLAKHEWVTLLCAGRSDLTRKHASAQCAGISLRAGNTQVTPFDTTIEEGALQRILLHVARKSSRNQPSRDDVFSG